MKFGVYYKSDVADPYSSMGKGLPGSRNLGDGRKQDWWVENSFNGDLYWVDTARPGANNG